jgi:hypothetical protein
MPALGSACTILFGGLHLALNSPAAGPGSPERGLKMAFTARLATALCVLMAISTAQAQSPAMKVILLGTAGPEYFPDRLGISTLVEANGEKLLFDAGPGVNQRLYHLELAPPYHLNSVRNCG